MENQLKLNYDFGASYSVVETNEGRYLVTYDSQMGSINHRSHVVMPEWGTCTCGEWQDMQYPCRHACAYARNKNESFDCVKELYVACEHKGAALKSMFFQNVEPVIRDNIPFDGITLPNLVTKQAGRPKVKRFRRRSKFIDPKNTSSIICSLCHQRGHNRHTCTNETSTNMDIM